MTEYLKAEHERGEACTICNGSGACQADNTPARPNDPETKDCPCECHYT